MTINRLKPQAPIIRTTLYVLCPAPNRTPSPSAPVLVANVAPPIQEIKKLSTPILLPGLLMGFEYFSLFAICSFPYLQLLLIYLH